MESDKKPKVRTAQKNGGEEPVLLIESVLPRLHWSPSICRSQDALRFQLANIWSTTSTSKGFIPLKRTARRTLRACQLA